MVFSEDMTEKKPVGHVNLGNKKYTINYQVLFINFHSKCFLMRDYLDIIPNWVPNTENDVQEFLLNFLDYIMAGIKRLVITGLNASAIVSVLLYKRLPTRSRNFYKY